MDNYTFRTHLNAVIIGLRALAEAGMLDYTETQETIEFLSSVEGMSNSARTNKILLTMGQHERDPGA